MDDINLQRLHYVIYSLNFILMRKSWPPAVVLLVFPHSIVVSYFPFLGRVFPLSFLSQSPLNIWEKYRFENDISIWIKLDHSHYDNFILKLRHTLFCKWVSPSWTEVSFGRIHPPAWLLFETNSAFPSEGDTKLPAPVVLLEIAGSFGIINGDALIPPDGEEIVLLSGSMDFGAVDSFFSGDVFRGDC